MKHNSNSKYLFYQTKDNFSDAFLCSKNAYYNGEAFCQFTLDDYCDSNHDCHIQYDQGDSMVDFRVFHSALAQAFKC